MQYNFFNVDKKSSPLKRNALICHFKSPGELRTLKKMKLRVIFFHLKTANIPQVILMLNCHGLIKSNQVRVFKYFWSLTPLSIKICRNILNIMHYIK